MHLQTKFVYRYPAPACGWQVLQGFAKTLAVSKCRLLRLTDTSFAPASMHSKPKN